VSSDKLMVRKLLRMSAFFLNPSIVEDTLVDFGTPISDQVNMSSNSTSDSVDEIAESNIPALPSKSFEFPCVEYGFMVVPVELSHSESSEFLAKIQQMIFDVSSFTGYLEFVLKSNISVLEGFDVCHPMHHIYLFPIIKSYV